MVERLRGEHRIRLEFVERYRSAVGKRVVVRHARAYGHGARDKAVVLAIVERPDRDDGVAFPSGKRGDSLFPGAEVDACFRVQIPFEEQG